MAHRVLGTKFFNRPTLMVAKQLLGKFLVRRLPPTADSRGRSKSRTGADMFAGMITEVEAYIGLEDKASHASRGETPRNRVMFGSAGRWYIYFTYGMHWMLNVVTEREGFPAAVLIRATDVVSGPGRLTKFFKIDKDLNGKPLNKKTGLWIEDREVRIKSKQVREGKRIGVDYAGRWKNKLWRFSL